MNLINKLESISKEKNIPLVDVMQKFTEYNDLIYKRDYGIFQNRTNNKAITMLEDFYSK